MDKKLHLASPPPTIGQPTPAPGVVMRMNDGSLQIFPQVLCIGIADPVIAQMVGQITSLVAQELLGVFEKEGVLAPGALQRYRDSVPSRNTPPDTAESNFQLDKEKAGVEPKGESENA